MKKKVLTSVCALAILIGVGSASAGTAGITYAKTLPFLSGDTVLAVGQKDNNSQAKIVNSLVGGSYKANMWINTGQHGSKVSATATNVTDNDTRYLTVDQSAVGASV